MPVRTWSLRGTRTTRTWSLTRPSRLSSRRSGLAAQRPDGTAAWRHGGFSGLSEHCSSRSAASSPRTLPLYSCGIGHTFGTNIVLHMIVPHVNFSYFLSSTTRKKDKNTQGIRVPCAAVCGRMCGHVYGPGCALARGSSGPSRPSPSVRACGRCLFEVFRCCLAQRITEGPVQGRSRGRRRRSDPCRACPHRLADAPRKCSCESGTRLHYASRAMAWRPGGYCANTLLSQGVRTAMTV